MPFGAGAVNGATQARDVFHLPTTVVNRVTHHVRVVATADGAVPPARRSGTVSKHAKWHRCSAVIAGDAAVG
jgi:hypothetical protein